MLLVPGEALTIVMRHHLTDGTETVTGPWASGAPAIVAYVAAGLGAPTTLVAGVGRDREGERILGRLQHAGVDTSAIVHSDLPTAGAIAHYAPDGSRRFDFSVVGSAALDVPVTVLGDLPERASWVHLSGATLQFGGPLAKTAIDAVLRGHAAGARISVDPNIRPEVLTDNTRDQLAEILPLADVVLPSDGELEALAVSADRLIAAGAVVCHTAGERGATVSWGTRSVHVPALAVTAVDVDGAGDTFAGAFLAAMARGAEPVEAARYGSAAAALAVQVPGAMEVGLEALAE